MSAWVRAVVAVACCFTSVAGHCQTKSAWAFYDVKLSEIVRIGLSQLLNKSFVADDALIRDERRVTLDLKQDQAQRAGPVLIELLMDAGYKVEEVNGLWKIRKAIDKDKELENETFIYRPQFRSASYFYDVLGIGKNRNGATSRISSDGSNTGSSSYFRGAGPTSETSAASANANSQDTASAYIDRAADVVYFRGSASEIAKYRQAIEALDVPESQVDVTVTVFEYSSSEEDRTAIGAVYNLAAGRLTGAIGALDSIGDFFKLASGNFQLLVSMVSGDKRFQLVSAPNVRTKSGAVARVSVGNDVPTLGSTTANNGSVTQSVSYQKTGVILELTPTVFEKTIDLKVRQTVSEAIATVTGVNNSPTLTNRELLTNVTMQDGESMVLGGLTSSKKTDGTRGLSFLPKLLHSTDKNTAGTELIVFIRATKVKQQPVTPLVPVLPNV